MRWLRSGFLLLLVTLLLACACGNRPLDDPQWRLLGFAGEDALTPTILDADI